MKKFVAVLVLGLVVTGFTVEATAVADQLPPIGGGTGSFALMKY